MPCLPVALAGCPKSGEMLPSNPIVECAAFVYLFGNTPALSDSEAFANYIDSVSGIQVPAEWRAPETDIMNFAAELRSNLAPQTQDPLCVDRPLQFAVAPEWLGIHALPAHEDRRLHPEGSDPGAGFEPQLAPGTLDLPCGSTTGDRQVICAADTLPPSTGSHLMAFARHKAAIPPANPNRSYVFALVVDSDGAAINNWIYRGNFDWDYFQGTDRWYQLIWDHVNKAWKVTVTQVDNAKTMTEVPSSVRAIREKDAVMWAISSDEFPIARPKYRLTAFVHDGRFTAGMRGGDVTGANPTEPLRDPGP